MNVRPNHNWLVTLSAMISAALLAGCPGQLGTDDPCKWLPKDQDHPLCPQWAQDTGHDVQVPSDAAVDVTPRPDEDITKPGDTAADSLVDTTGVDLFVGEDVATPTDEHSDGDTPPLEDTVADVFVDPDAPGDVAVDLWTAPDVPTEVCESFASSIQPLLDVDCVICHKGPNGSLGLFLTADVAIDALVNSPSTHIADKMLVTPFEPEASFLIDKLKDNPSHGTKMPLGKTAWTPAVVELVSDWIASGATAEPFNCESVDP